MPRVLHTLQTLNALYSTTGKNLTMLAADPANDERVPISDKIIVIATNLHATIAATVTVNSVALNNRTGDITAHSVAAQTTTIFGPFVSSGWAQSSGELNF